MSTDRLTEILNYLSAMSRDMGEFRQEVKARLDGLEKRLDGLEARLGGVEKRLDLFELVVRAKFDDMSSDIRRLHQRFESVQEDYAELRIEQRDQRKRIESLERKQA